ncbi:ABC transporter substrate-binding protein [Cohnella sp.]|uniref:ABC transporter substrate-binding protein n=1 Tax=Cohnella sp. TaxID=1883426 RepID=UPI0035666877
MNNKRSNPLTFIALVFMIVLTGCQSPASIGTGPHSTSVNSGDGWETASPTAESLPSDKQIVLGFSQLGSESDWRKANTLSIHAAAEEAGIDLVFANAEQSQAKQFDAIHSFIDQKVDVIAIAPVIQYGWEPILKEVKQAGIPVILFDRSVEVSDTSLFVTLIGSDFYEEGRKAGKYLLDKMRDRTEPAGIVELQGTVGSAPSVERGKGFHEVVKEREPLIMLGSEPANFTKEEGKKVMSSFLKEHGKDIHVLFSHNDDMALGAIEAIEEYGLEAGKDIIIISVDGTKQAFEKMAEGKINCIVECNPLLGPHLMQAVKELMEGRTLPKRIVPTESVFTEEMAKKEVGNRKY